MSLVLGLSLEHSCTWPQNGLSSEGLSLASDFFCVLGLGLEPCVLDSTSVYYLKQFLFLQSNRFRAVSLQAILGNENFFNSSVAARKLSEVLTLAKLRGGADAPKCNCSIKNGFPTGNKISGKTNQ